MRRSLAHSFGNRRPGDTVLSGGYPVCNGLSRHPESDQIYGHRNQNGSNSSETAWALWTVSVFKISCATWQDERGRERGGGIARRRQALHFACRLAGCQIMGDNFFHPDNFSCPKDSVWTCNYNCPYLVNLRYEPSRLPDPLRRQSCLLFPYESFHIS